MARVSELKIAGAELVCLRVLILHSRYLTLHMKNGDIVCPTQSNNKPEISLCFLQCATKLLAGVYRGTDENEVSHFPCSLFRLGHLNVVIFRDLLFLYVIPPVINTLYEKMHREFSSELFFVKVLEEESTVSMTEVGKQYHLIPAPTISGELLSTQARINRLFIIGICLQNLTIARSSF